MYDFAIIGGGIVGLSVGMALVKRFPRAKIAVIEKEKDLAQHQTGRNSGVIHSGIYYPPGSLKAKLAREGNAAIVAFCEEHGIPHEVCGKVIVAADPEELQQMERLYRRGRENGLEIFRLGQGELKEREPHVRGMEAIYVPKSGIVDYKAVARAFARIIREGSGHLLLDTRVENIVETKEQVTLETNRGTWSSRFLINCAGLYSDRVAEMAGQATGLKIVPFRGEYVELVPEKRHLVQHLIYPVPNPDFPFLGVHFTRMIDGSVHVGPNAVLSLKREGYKKTDVDIADLAEILSYKGFWKLVLAHIDEGLKEMIRSVSKKAFLRSLQRLIPELTEKDLVPAQAGVRAQALRPDGSMVDDFAILPGKRSLHVCNAPSPAATASMKIGEAIVNQIPEPALDQIPTIRQSI
ncbi:MAG: L-2-hydroxyglutarate oxidase [Firmicutes bacterium]|uniref:L-2-hydroxyglutarate oxidase n=1 Tax=Melghirimyces thermohalophilus TaxID=1236220 RepID=A0A1G6ISS5_9BACL|nr:L-2-hydroxyglutarate oxidase [Melghirimyces thermohalophilus]MDA8351583.1 L-2-hydroxyglutarate oxidase [Bacillota bacterium]SDC09549.1 L-2-hydroxyglutarate oxidase [Melghirimyces thermohalophilus]